MTERFVPIAPAVVEWRVTFDSPHTWTRPWTFAMILKQATHGEKLYEYTCREGNYGLKNILTGARAADNGAAAGRFHGASRRPRPERTTKTQNVDSAR